jgi:hypothetical protein
MKYFIDAICGLAILAATPYGIHKAHNWLRIELIKKCTKGLPSLEKFSRALTRRND